MSSSPQNGIPWPRQRSPVEEHFRRLLNWTESTTLQASWPYDAPSGSQTRSFAFGSQGPNDNPIPTTPTFLPSAPVNDAVHGSQFKHNPSTSGTTVSGASTNTSQNSFASYCASCESLQANGPSLMAFFGRRAHIVPGIINSNGLPNGQVVQERNSVWSLGRGVVEHAWPQFRQAINDLPDALIQGSNPTWFLNGGSFVGETSQARDGSRQNLRPTTTNTDNIPQHGRAFFRPSAMLNPSLRARRENPSPEEVARRVAAGVSPNYRGNYRLVQNRPADIPESQNCSVYITGLPPSITTSQLLAVLRGTGRVWASVITPPGGRYTTAAAKVTFFSAQAEQILLARANDALQPGLLINGHRTRVVPDRNRVAEATAPADRTRVITISGPPHIITIPNLEYFSGDFVYQLDEVLPLVMGNAINILEWRFGSYRCQAQWAWRNLLNDPFYQSHGVRVQFERDPCEW